MAFLRSVLCALCVAENLVSCTVDFPHSSPGFSQLPWEELGSGAAPAQPCPCAQPSRRDLPSPEKLALTSALSFSCWFFCREHSLQAPLREGNAQACLLHQRKQHQRKAASVVCMVPLVSSLYSALWTEVSIYKPDGTWRAMTAAVGYSWMIMAFLPSAAGWQAQRNADSSQNEVKHGT